MASKIESTSSSETASQKEDINRRFCKARPLSIVRLPHTVGWPHLVQISDIVEAAFHDFVASHNMMTLTLRMHHIK